MLTSQKYLFHLPPGLHYLNNAYKAPLLKASEQACLQALERAKDPTAVRPADFFSHVEEVKQAFGQVVHCRAREVAVIPSVSYGMASVLENIACKPGQHALTIENEFPSNVFTLHRWCKQHGAELKWIKSGIEGPRQGRSWNDYLLRAINEQTALVLISSVHWMNGLKFDLEKIGKRCREAGAKFIVDGTQSVGALPMDVEKFKIDALICAGYKWLLGPYSLGLAYMGKHFHQGKPIEESWMNRSNAEDFANLTTYDPTYKAGAARYSMGESSNFLLMPMLHAALKMLNQWTAEGIQAYAAQLIQPLLTYLESEGVQLEEDAYFSPHLFGLSLPEQTDEKAFQQQLQSRRISLSVRGQSLRLSVNVFNDEEDIAQLIQAIEQSQLTRSVSKG